MARRSALLMSKSRADGSHHQRGSKSNQAEPQGSAGAGLAPAGWAFVDLPGLDPARGQDRPCPTSRRNCRTQARRWPARNAAATAASPSRNEMSVMGGIIPGHVDGANHPTKP